MKKVLFLIIVFASLFSCSHKVTEKDAFIMSKQLVDIALKSKGINDASFSFADYRFDDIKNGGYIIESDFTTKNAQGTKVTVKYRAKLRYKEGKWSDVNNWTLEDLKFLD